MDSITTFYYRYLRYIQAKDDATATLHDKYMALSYAVRSQIVNKWIETQKYYHESNPRRVYYLSMEYILGKNLKLNIINQGLEKNVSEAAENLGFSLDELYEQEDDIELGNGGKGHFAACMQDSMASIGLAGMGYGVHYDFALFKQQIVNGMQTEYPYDWLHTGHAWEIKRPEYACIVGFYGKIKSAEKKNLHAGMSYEWTPADEVVAVPHDIPICGYENNTVNTLRLWSSQSSEVFLPDYRNHRDYIRACEDKFQAGRITNCLLPDENIRRATELRMKQQYFFVSASLQDIIRRYKLHNAEIRKFDQKVVIHLNGSRCAIAMIEFMRLLIDVEKISWNEAWRITKNVFTYNTHALSLENLEKLPIYLLEEILPRHTQIIYEINQNHIDTLRSKGCDDSLIRELSLIEEGEVKWARMAHVALLGARHINGVSQAQTETLKKKLFYQYCKNLDISVKNYTHGISLRRWLLVSNRPLAGLISEAIGDGWIKDHTQLQKLEQFVDDSELLLRLGDIKHAAKRHLVAYLARDLKMELDSMTFFDIHCNKVHLYKRQILHALYIVSTYLRIIKGNHLPMQRTHIFGGRATPADFLGKQVIHLINIVADIVKNDSRTKNQLDVFFIPNYGMSIAEYVVPAADLSEQLATPGYEACGTSNMKFAINGAITIASKSGSNIELCDKVGNENIIMFGLSSKELGSLRNYNPGSLIESNEMLKTIFSFFDEVLPSFPEGGLIYPLLSSLRDSDPYYILLDFNDYVAKQESVEAIYKDRNRWLAMSLKNIIRTSWFSSDRMVNEYAREVWDLKEE